MTFDFLTYYPTFCSYFESTSGCGGKRTKERDFILFYFWGTKIEACGHLASFFPSSREKISWPNMKLPATPFGLSASALLSRSLRPPQTPWIDEFLLLRAALHTYQEPWRGMSFFKASLKA